MKSGGLLLAVGALLLIALMGGGCVYQGYQHAIVLDENVHYDWHQVENELQRRFDLIPNLVQTVKGIAEQEKSVFLGIAEARKSYGNATTTAEKAQAASQVESALSRLLVIIENYPELRSNESFLKLQDQLEGTENRLTVERQRYNDAVRTLNTFIRPFPGSFYASVAGVEKATYFEVSSPAAKEAPKVDFSPAEPAKKAEGA